MKVKKIGIFLMCFMLIVSMVVLVYADANVIELERVAAQYSYRLITIDPNGKTLLCRNGIDDIYIYYIEQNLMKKLFRDNVNDNYARYNYDGTKIYYNKFIIDVSSGTYEEIDGISYSDKGFWKDNENVIILLYNKFVKYNIYSKTMEDIDFNFFYMFNISNTPDGEYVAYQSSHVVEIRKVNDFSLVKSFGNGIEPYFSSTGKYLALSVSSSDGKVGGTNVYRTEDYELVGSADSTGTVSFCNNDSIMIIDEKMYLESENFSKAYEIEDKDYMKSMRYTKGVITPNGKYYIQSNGDLIVYDAYPLTYRITNIEIEPKDIKIDLNQGNTSQLSVTAIYSNGDRVKLANKDVKFVFGEFINGSVNENGLLTVNNNCNTYVTAEYKGFKDKVNVFAAKAPRKLIVVDNQLEWEKVDGADGYYIYRKDYSANSYGTTPLNEFPIKDNKYFDDNALNNPKDYKYVVVAVYGNNQSSYSNEVTNKKLNIEMKLQIGTPNMFVNGVQLPIDANGTVPVIKNNRTLLPIRAIVEQLGGSIYWNGQARSIEISLGKDLILLNIGQNVAYVNGVQKTLDVAPEIINGRTMIPVRFVTENLNCKIDWDGVNRIVTIKYNN